VKAEVYGLQRSGTNYLEWVLHHCFGIDVQYGVLKHHLPEELNLTDNPKVLIYKDFDHWKSSIERMPVDLYLLRGDDVNLKQFHTDFNSKWKKRIPSVRYEDFLIDYKGSLEKLSKIFNIPILNYDQPRAGSLHRSQDFKPEDVYRYVPR